MKYFIKPNGNLVIASENNDKEMLEDLKERCKENDITFLAELLEETGWEGNGQLMMVNPEDIAALTDAPILTNDRTIEDDGNVIVNGNVWWYPNYMITNFADVLIENGSVEFDAAPENQNDKNKFMEVNR